MKTKTVLSIMLSMLTVILFGTTYVNAATGWIEEDGYWYYYETDDYYITNDRSYCIYNQNTDSSDCYGFDEEGHMIIGWYDWDNDPDYENMYYYGADGKTASGLTEIYNVWYYFDYDGELLEYYFSIDGNHLLKTDENGVVIVNIELDEGWNEVGNDWYYVKNGIVLRNEWLEENNNWYYFDGDGAMAQNSSNFWIYDYNTDDYKVYGFDADGRMITGWYDWDEDYDYERLYYYHDSGEAADGITTINNVTYYFDSGELLTNYSTITSDNVLIATNADGVVVDNKQLNNGWNEAGNDWYYVQDGNPLKSQFAVIDGETYYFYYNGRMACDETTSIWNENTDEYSYYGFDEEGHMIIGWYNWSHDSDYSDMYYYSNDGSAVRGLVEIEGTKYYFGYDGELYDYDTTIEENGIIYIIKDGVVTQEVVLKEGWNEIDGSEYYYENGIMITDQFKTINGKIYYFNYEGQIVKNEYTYEIYNPETEESAYYGFKPDGEMIVGWYNWADEYYENWYYYHSDGVVAHGKTLVDGINYLFRYGRLKTSSVYLDENKGMIYQTNENGVIVSEQPLIEGWNQIGENWYYVKNGQLIRDELLTIGTVTYYLDYEGIMVENSHRSFYDYDTDTSYYLGFGPGGAMLKSGWYKWSSDDVYYDERNEWWAYYDFTTGKAATGPTTIDGNRYLFNYRGVLLEDFGGVYQNVIYETNSSGVITDEITITDGWIQAGNNWFYAENNKLVRNDFRTIDGFTYYFNYDGIMACDTVYSIYDENDEEFTYRFDKSGHMVIGWYLDEDGDWYYYKADGTAAYGEMTVDGVNYFFNWSGIMYSDFCGILKYNGTRYFYTIANSGAITDRTKPTEGFNNYGGNTYYYKDGGFANEEIILDNGSYYYFDYDGHLVKNNIAVSYYDYFEEKEVVVSCDKDGKLFTNTWIRDDYEPSTWYYHGNDGKALEGWQSFGGTWYYLKPNMACDESLEIDGQLHLFDDNGVWVGEVTTTNGWNLAGGHYYYIENSKIVHGWKCINSVWYYFGRDGRMESDSVLDIYTNEYYDEYDYYSFAIDGSMFSNTWVEETMYAKADGKLAKNEWLLLNGNWYYFDYLDAVTDDTLIDGTIYHFNSDGTWKGTSVSTSALNGWVKEGQNWFFYQNGKVLKDWQRIGGYWYYFDKYDGIMATGIRYCDGEYYYFTNDGQMVETEGWYKYHGYDIYVNPDGKLADGWQLINGKWYYFSIILCTDNVMYIDDVWYSFDSNGTYSVVTPVNGWNLFNNKWYYFDAEENEFLTGAVLINGTYYYLSPYMQTNEMFRAYYFDSNGVLFTNGWVKYEGDWYYINAQGISYRNQTRIIDGKVYTFDRYGRMI